MKSYAFDNQKFDSWLNQETAKVLNKLSKGEALSNKEELILLLKSRLEMTAEMKLFFNCLQKKAN